LGSDSDSEETETNEEFACANPVDEEKRQDDGQILPIVEEEERRLASDEDVIVKSVWRMRETRTR